jgi:hypothetical protein
MQQHEIIEFVQNTVKSVLDVHNPMNENKIYSKEVYSFPLSKDARALKKAKNMFFNRYRYATRNSVDQAEIDIKFSLYAKFRNAFTSLK